jgi:pilus assembly protein CpaB
MRKIDIRPTIPLILSIALGTAAVLMVRNYLSGEKVSMTQGLEPVRVVVASKNIPANVPITMEMVASRGVPKKFVHANAIYPEEGDLLIGRELLYPVRAGDPILWMDFKGGERYRGFSSMIREGERALTLRVDESSGIAGMLQPGDHIDILGTFTDSSKTTELGANRGSGVSTTITLLQNVVVLAVGTMTSAGSGGRTGGREGSGMLTLLVTPEEAELLVHAEQSGNLQNILRNPGDIETFENLPRITFTDILQPKIREEIQSARDNRILVIRGGVEAREEVE